MSILCGSLGSNVNWRDIHLNVLSNTFLKHFMRMGVPQGGGHIVQTLQTLPVQVGNHLLWERDVKIVSNNISWLIGVCSYNMAANVIRPCSFIQISGILLTLAVHTDTSHSSGSWGHVTAYSLFSRSKWALNITRQHLPHMIPLWPAMFWIVRHIPLRSPASHCWCLIASFRSAFSHTALWQHVVVVFL